MAGETALARQLKNLAVPQTSLLLQDKIRKSFLFDHRDAAALDRDVFFSYGTTGLEKLKIINPIFEKFESHLFHVSYVGFERAVHSASVNEKLNEKITEFLRLLSPYFLIRAAHEALEWLIYRFHIHLYNADALVASVLPHFNTSTFVRVVQLLNLEDPNDRWHWLKTVQKSGVHLEYVAILNRFNTDGSFRKFVCDLAPNSFKVFHENPSFATPVISFSMTTVYCALGRSDAIKDSTITFLSPYILKGLKSDYNKYIASSYLVISKIIEKVQLQDDLVIELLLKVFENVKPDLMEKALELLLVVFQRQPIQSLTKRLFQTLLSTKGFLQYFVSLTENHECASLLSAIIKRLIPTLLALRLRRSSSNKCKKLFKFVSQFFNSVVLDKKVAILCLNLIMNNYTKLEQQQGFDQKILQKTAMVLLKQMEVKYPEYFDKAIGIYFKKTKGVKKKALHELINNSVCCVKNEVVPDLETTLILGLNHANPQVRKLSTKYLVQRTVSKELTDIDFVRDSLYERLCDDNFGVVHEVLSSPVILFQYIDKKKILSAFGNILNKKGEEESSWYEIQITCLDVICYHFANYNDLINEVFITVLPFIFPVKKTLIKGFFRILNSSLKKFLPVLQVLEIPNALASDLESKVTNKKVTELNYVVFSSIRKYIEKLDDSAKSSLVSFLMEKSAYLRHNSFLTIYVHMMGQIVISTGNLDQKLVCIQHILSFLRTFPYRKVAIENYLDITEESLVDLCIDSLSKDKFPTVIVYHTFFKIVKFMNLNYKVINSIPWLFKSDNSHVLSFKILTSLFEFCIQQVSGGKSFVMEIFQNVISVLVASQFQKPKFLLGFLSLLWSNVLETFPVTLQIAALKVAKDALDNSFKFDWFFNNYSFSVCLLKAIGSSEIEVRKSALALLSSLLQHSGKCNLSLKSLFENIAASQEEITIDYRQCLNVLNNWLTPAVDIYGLKKGELSVESNEFKNHHQYIVLDNFIKLLSEDNTPNSIKHFILLSLENADSNNLLKAYIPLINSFLQKFKENDNSLDNLALNIMDLLLQKFTPKTAVTLLDNCIETKTFFDCLHIKELDSNYMEIQLSILKPLTREFFVAIPSISVQKQLLETLLNVYIVSPSEISNMVKKVLSKICTYAYLILKDFNDRESSTQKNITVREVKKSRTKEGTEINSNVFESKRWTNITVLLEIIQNKSKLEKRQLLIPELFSLLNKTLNFETHSTVEYVRQLILLTIYNCCQHLGSNGLDERQFQVELIVQCIRSSTNPKTHHQSLLLLNLAATMFPDYVLNNVMSIFTFMGSSLVRQDDSYSIQVISQTIETIVPSLLAASNNQKETDTVQIVASVIRVFVNCLLDIPRHRQLPLFSKLITTLDPSEFLWIPLAQVCDQYATVLHDVTSQDMNDYRKISPTLEFAVNLHKQFSPSVQIDTCINLFNLLCTLPNNKEELTSNVTASLPNEPFNVANHTNQQLQKYKYNILSYINIWLSSQAFVSQVSELDSKGQHGLEEKYETLLEKALRYLQHLRDMKVDHTEDFKKQHGLFPLLFDLVGHINSLLPSSLFIKVVHRLLCNRELIIQKKAIELLNCKLEQHHHLFTEENHPALLKLLRPLLKVVAEFENEGTTKIENSALNQQTALYALHLLAKKIGSEYPRKFHKVLKATIQILGSNQNQELTVNALLCLAQLCISLNVQILPHLNTFMPMIVNFFNDNRILNFNDCLIMGIITALQSLVENLGMFLSVYMPSIVIGICILSIKYQEINKKALQEKLLNFQTLLARNVSLRILLTALEDSYLAISTKEPIAIAPLMLILEKKLSFCKYEEIEASASHLEKFYILLLGFRSSHSNLSIMSIESISNVESSIISALKTFVVKLSVTHFRCFFQKIYQWVVATENNEEENLKVCIFYNLTNELSVTLKTLFVSAAKYFLKHAASKLDLNNSTKKEDLVLNKNPELVSRLLNNILDTLNTCFIYDDGHLLDKDNFEILMQPIVDQLENIYSSDIDYKDRVTNHLNSCIAHFMAAVSDNTLWKKLNYQILMKTRHDSPMVRFAAIQAIREVVNVMGDNYLVLLPESIPFLAEVMEDESSEVEHECQIVITEMEKILGEPIRKYF